MTFHILTYSGAKKFSSGWHFIQTFKPAKVSRYLSLVVTGTKPDNIYTKLTNIKALSNLWLKDV